MTASAIASVEAIEQPRQMLRVNGLTLVGNLQIRIALPALADFDEQHRARSADRVAFEIRASPKTRDQTLAEMQSETPAQRQQRNEQYKGAQ